MALALITAWKSLFAQRVDFGVLAGDDGGVAGLAGQQGRLAEEVALAQRGHQPRLGLPSFRRTSTLPRRIR